MIHHAHFEVGKYVRLTLKDGSTEEGRIVDIYDVRGDEYVTLVRQGQLFHNPVAIEKVQAVENVIMMRPQAGKSYMDLFNERKGKPEFHEVVEIPDDPNVALEEHERYIPRSKRTQEIFDRVVERNGDALTRLAKEDE